MKENISNAVEEQKERMLDSLLQLIRIPSVSGVKEEVGRSLDYMLGLADSMGFRTKSLFDKKVGIVEWGEGEETLGIVVHVDVVAPGEITNWKHKPFEPVIEDGMVWGRGAQDDKGPAISALYALHCAKESGVKFHKKVRIIIGTQEEGADWSDLEQFVREGDVPDYGFTPDGEFPVCNIEKGVANVKITFPVETSMPHGCFIKSVDGGTAANIVPDQCSAVLVMGGKEITITAEGKSVHSCLPERGDNAIINLCKVLDKMKLEGSLSGLCRFILDKFSETDCSGIGLKSESDHYNGEYVHVNCVSPTVIETGQNGVILSINLRFSYGLDEEKLKFVIRNLAEAMGGTITECSVMPAIYVDKNKPFVKKCMEAYEAFGGEAGATSLEYGGSYAKAIPNVFCWGPVFPGEAITMHQVDESIRIESFMRMTKIFTKAIVDIVSTDAAMKGEGGK